HLNPSGNRFSSQDRGFYRRLSSGGESLSELSVPKRIPAPGRQCCFGSVVANEDDLLLARDLADARDGNFRREATKQSCAFWADGEEQAVIFAAMKSKFKRVQV